MKPHEQRVVEEKDLLGEKLEKLKGFINLSPIFRALPFEDRRLLYDQADWMKGYYDTLLERVERFERSRD